MFTRRYRPEPNRKLAGISGYLTKISLKEVSFSKGHKEYDKFLTYEYSTHSRATYPLGWNEKITLSNFFDEYGNLVSKKISVQFQ